MFVTFSIDVGWFQLGEFPCTGVNTFMYVNVSIIYSYEKKHNCFHSIDGLLKLVHIDNIYVLYDTFYSMQVYKE